LIRGFPGKKFFLTKLSQKFFLCSVQIFPKFIRPKIDQSNCLLSGQLLRENEEVEVTRETTGNTRNFNESLFPVGFRH